MKLSIKRKFRGEDIAQRCGEVQGPELNPGTKRKKKKKIQQGIH